MEIKLTKGIDLITKDKGEKFAEAELTIDIKPEVYKLVAELLYAHPEQQLAEATLKESYSDSVVLSFSEIAHESISSFTNRLADWEIKFTDLYNNAQSHIKRTLWENEISSRLNNLEGLFVELSSILIEQEVTPLEDKKGHKSKWWGWIDRVTKLDKAKRVK